MMKSPEYWKSHYVTTTDPAEVARAIKVAPVGTGPEGFELIHFPAAEDAPNILISQGSGGHGYVFAELGLRRYAERAERWLADAEPPVGFLAESA